MKRLTKGLFTLAAVAISGTLMATPPTVAGDGGDPSCFPPSTCVPIDSHIYWLVAAALIFGAYKVFQLRKAQ